MGVASGGGRSPRPAAPAPARGRRRTPPGRSRDRRHRAHARRRPSPSSSGPSPSAARPTSSTSSRVERAEALIERPSRHRAHRPPAARAPRRHRIGTAPSRTPRRRSTSWPCSSTPPAPTSASASCSARARPRHLRRQGQGRGAAPGAAEVDADTVVFDDELTPAQQLNLEKLLGPHRHRPHRGDPRHLRPERHTRRARPRSSWPSSATGCPAAGPGHAPVSQQAGGIGTRGPGRDPARGRPPAPPAPHHEARGRAAPAPRTRRTQRKARAAPHPSTVSLVGYTNAGKSTLLNRLTDAGVLVEDRLFATLDPTAAACSSRRRGRARSPTPSASSASCPTTWSRRSSRRSRWSPTPTSWSTSSTPRRRPRGPDRRRARRPGEIGAGDVPELLVFNKVRPRRPTPTLRSVLARHPGRWRLGPHRRGGRRPPRAIGDRLRALATWSSCSSPTTAATCWPPSTARARCWSRSTSDEAATLSGPPRYRGPPARRSVSSESASPRRRRSRRCRGSSRRRTRTTGSTPLAAVAERTRAASSTCRSARPSTRRPRRRRGAGLPSAAERGYPPSIGTAALREAAAAWIGARFGVDVDPSAVAACIGTKELVAGCPSGSLRRPDRDTVLYPAGRLPDLRDGRDPRRLPGGARARRRPLAPRPRRHRPRRRRAGAVPVGRTRPATPPARPRRPRAPSPRGAASTACPC